MAPAAIAAYAALAAAAVSAAAAYSQGQQQKAMSEYNAEVATNEGIAAQQQAAFEEQRHRQQVQRMLSTQRAQIGASGLDLEGSPLAVMDESAASGELDALLIRHGGAIKQNRAQSQATLDGMQANNAATQGYYGAGASLLSGVSSYGKIMYGPKTTGTTAKAED